MKNCEEILINTKENFERKIKEVQKNVLKEIDDQDLKKKIENTKELLRKETVEHFLKKTEGKIYELIKIENSERVQKMEKLEKEIKIKMDNQSNLLVRDLDEQKFLRNCEEKIKECERHLHNQFDYDMKIEKEKTYTEIERLEKEMKKKIENYREQTSAETLETLIQITKSNEIKFTDNQNKLTAQVSGMLEKEPKKKKLEDDFKVMNIGKIITELKEKTENLQKETKINTKSTQNMAETLGEMRIQFESIKDDHLLNEKIINPLFDSSKKEIAENEKSEKNSRK